mmetsp:Transcript_21708/g.45188  ORF Transcript_21708/g.45188 Transcript_21708/m.45188 type:complete len:354 (-) Transcript_21708:61-1122(-)
MIETMTFQHKAESPKQRISVFLFIIAAISFYCVFEIVRDEMMVGKTAQDLLFAEPRSRELTTTKHAFPRDFSNISSYEDLIHAADFNTPVPHDLNLVFMGDSLTRYQYLDLAFYLSRNGTWFNEVSDDPHIEARYELSWNSFYAYTDEILRPYEQLCDCARKDNVHQARENRYFYDEMHNNRLVYLQKLGKISFRTSWNISHINKHGPQFLVNNPDNFKVAQIMNWTDSVEKFVCNLIPKPTHFIFNSGWWFDNDFNRLAAQEEIVRALRECNIISVYKTTTISKSRNRIEQSRERMCQMADICLNVSWTRFVPQEFYLDEVHFAPPIYSLLNIHLLSMLTSEEGGLQIATES